MSSLRFEEVLCVNDSPFHADFYIYFQQIRREDQGGEWVSWKSSRSITSSTDKLCLLHTQKNCQFIHTQNSTSAHSHCK